MTTSLKCTIVTDELSELSKFYTAVLKSEPDVITKSRRCVRAPTQRSPPDRRRLPGYDVAPVWAVEVQVLSSHDPEPA